MSHLDLADGRRPELVAKFRIASAVRNEGLRSPASSREMVEWLMLVRIANMRCVMRRSAIASRSQPLKSPPRMRLRSGTCSPSRCASPFS